VLAVLVDVLDLPADVLAVLHHEIGYGDAATAGGMSGRTTSHPLRILVDPCVRRRP
jgi:hypothetical protein